MEKNPNGDWVFYSKNPLKRAFILRKHVLDRHLKEHPGRPEYTVISDYLDKIKKTFLKPDCIAGGPRGKVIYFRVLKRYAHNNRLIVFKIPLYRHKKKKNLFMIATGFVFVSDSYDVINRNEKITWKKETSPIF